MNQAVAVKNEELTPTEKRMVAKAQKLFERFNRDCGMAGFGRHEAYVLLGHIKSALGIPESRLTLQSALDVDEEYFVRRISMNCQ
ncbi:MAG TPA: hypothetical protein VFY28_03005 [Candidatus Paceibacterota bacterium]|nr:hypothetical protein [Candidatus Paceibacterota bacterium]